MTAALLATVDALGWAILHALWQLTALAALLWIALRMTDARAAAVRCWLCVAALLCAPVLFGVTAVQHWDLPAAEVASLAALSPGALEAPLVVPEPAFSPPPSWEVEDALPAVVGAWGLGVVVLGLTFLGGLRRTRQLQTEGLSPVSAALAARVAALAGAIGIRHPVLIAVSSRVSVPSVVGLLRPIVLLPPVALTGLDSQQLESIILHELAHVRRRDLWINLVQGLVEILLFFHPAVWWMSRRLRAERELACDDVVVAQGMPPLVYARALLALEEQRASERTLAVAATDGSLRHRVERLVGRARPPQRGARGLAAALLLSLLTLASAQQSVAADNDLGVMVSDLLEMEIRLPDGDPPRAAQDDALRGDLMAITDQHAAIMARIETLLAADPERWALEVTVRAGQASEHIADAIEGSDIPSYLDDDQASVYQDALVKKATVSRQKALKAYEKALTLEGAPRLLAEARDGAARMTEAIEAVASRPAPEPAEADPAETAALVKKASSVSADDPGAGVLWLMTAERLFDAGDASGALRWYLAAEGALEEPGRIAFARYKAAWCHHSLGQHSDAIEQMTAVARSGATPVAEEAMADLVRFYTDAGRAAEGEAWFADQGASQIWTDGAAR